MLEPAYADGLVTLYQGDALELLPAVLKAHYPGVMVTDPPYGIDYRSSQAGRYRGRAVAGDADVAARDRVLELWAPRPAIVFGDCRRPAPADVRATLVWDKGLGVGMGDLSIPWRPNWEHIYVLGDGFRGHRGSGVLRHNSVSWATRGRPHPMAKPEALMRDLLIKCPPGPVLDPFAGAGATLIAAKSLGRPAIGIELDREWIDEAIARLGQEVLGLDLGSGGESQTVMVAFDLGDP